MASTEQTKRPLPPKAPIARLGPETSYYDTTSEARRMSREQAPASTPKKRPRRRSLSPIPPDSPVALPEPTPALTPSPPPFMLPPSSPPVARRVVATGTAHDNFDSSLQILANTHNADKTKIRELEQEITKLEGELEEARDEVRRERQNAQEVVEKATTVIAHGQSMAFRTFCSSLDELADAVAAREVGSGVGGI